MSRVDSAVPDDRAEADTVVRGVPEDEEEDEEDKKEEDDEGEDEDQGDGYSE